MDVELVKFKPTWPNKIIGENIIVKRLDLFLVEEKLVDQNLIFKQWFDVGRESNHLPIFLELQGGLKKLANPFKFCASWLKD